MAKLRYNPPPNWPAPPPGWSPAPGWQPDPAWGPPPQGWQLYTDSRNWFLRHKVATAGLAVVLLAAIGSTTNGGSGTGGPDTGTVASTAAATPQTATSSDTPSTTDSPTPTDTPSPTYSPSPKDFKLGIKVTKLDCFGEAGCNVEFHIDPSYTGQPVDGTWAVTYKVTGGDSGPQINTFTLTGDQASFDSVELLSVPSAATHITATVTDVSQQ